MAHLQLSQHPMSVPSVMYEKDIRKFGQQRGREESMAPLKRKYASLTFEPSDADACISESEIDAKERQRRNNIKNAAKYRKKRKMHMDRVQAMITNNTRVSNEQQQEILLLELENKLLTQQYRTLEQMLLRKQALPPKQRASQSMQLPCPAQNTANTNCGRATLDHGIDPESLASKLISLPSPIQKLVLLSALESDDKLSLQKIASGVANSTGIVDLLEEATSAVSNNQQQQMRTFRSPLRSGNAPPRRKARAYFDG